MRTSHHQDITLYLRVTQLLSRKVPELGIPRRYLRVSNVQDWRWTHLQPCRRTQRRQSNRWCFWLRRPVNRCCWRHCSASSTSWGRRVATFRAWLFNVHWFYNKVWISKAKLNSHVNRTIATTTVTTVRSTRCRKSCRCWIRRYRRDKYYRIAESSNSCISVLKHLLVPV